MASIDLEKAVKHLKAHDKVLSALIDKILKIQIGSDAILDKLIEQVDNLNGWLASQTNMLVTDWETVD